MSRPYLKYLDYSHIYLSRPLMSKPYLNFYKWAYQNIYLEMCHIFVSRPLMSKLYDFFAKESNLYEQTTNE